MTPKTLRRKLQKKAKHKPYRKCPVCGRRMRVSLINGYDKYRGEPPYRLFKVCGYLSRDWGGAIVSGFTPGQGCGYFEELFVSRVVERQTHTPEVSGSAS